MSLVTALRAIVRAKVPSRLFSTTHVRANDEMAQMKEVAGEGAAEAQQSTYSFSQQATSALTKTTKGWKTFRTNSFIRPHELTYKNRLEREMPRRPFELINPSRKVARAKDPFHRLGIDPLAECLNSKVMSHYLTDMAKIKPRRETMLTAKSQRRLGKAIRRAKMAGIIPWLSKAQQNYAR